MLTFSLTFIGMNILLLKYGLMSWLDSIQASGILATFTGFIDLAMKLLFGNCAN
jgi:hypothetical protein